MLVLARRPGESITIGDDIVVTVVAAAGGQVKLGITAPQHVRVLREEILKALKEENSAAAKGLGDALPLEALAKRWQAKRRKAQVASPAKQDAQSVPSTAARRFFFPDGLLGFSSQRNFVLSPYQPADGSASPFFVLQAEEDDLCFPLVSPHSIVSDYALKPPPEALAALRAGSPADLSVFVIVTLRERVEEITANLQGPILLNSASSLGLQLVVEHYPLRYPLINPR